MIDWSAREDNESRQHWWPVFEGEPVMRTLVSALSLAVFATPSATAACLEMPETITLKVDDVRATKPGYAYVTSSGFPPGQWRLRCAVRDKEGRYFGADFMTNLQTPASAPAHTMMIPIDSEKVDQIVGADCTAIPFIRKD
jgi:hypothetical protein